MSNGRFRSFRMVMVGFEEAQDEFDCVNWSLSMRLVSKRRGRAELKLSLENLVNNRVLHWPDDMNAILAIVPEDVIPPAILNLAPDVPVGQDALFECVTEKKEK